MKLLPDPTLRLFLASLLAAALTACGDAGDTPEPGKTVTGDVSVTLSFPVATSAASSELDKRRATAQAREQAQSYISAKTQSVSIVLASVDGAPPATPVGVTVDVKPGGACVVSGSNLDCTIKLAAPVGTDVFSVDTWPGIGGSGSMPISSGAGTAVVAANASADLAVNLLARVNEFAIEFTPASGAQPIDVAGTFTARIRAKDSAGDLITGATPYHDPIVVSDKDLLTGHITASPSLPATFDSPAQDTVTFTYDGAGTAASYGFYVKSGITQTVNLTFASNVEHLYVAERSSNRIDVYDIQDDGSLTGPSRSIVGVHTGLDNPTSIAVDSLGQLYVTNTHTLTVFAPGASDDATPLHTTTGADPIYVSERAGMIMNRVPSQDPYSSARNVVSINYPAGVAFGQDPDLPPAGIPPFDVGYATVVASYWSGAGGYVCGNYKDPDPNQDRVYCFTQPISWVTDPVYGTDISAFQIVNGMANYTLQCCHVNVADMKFLPNGVLVISSNGKYNTPAALETWIVNPEQRLTSIQGDGSGIESPGAIAVDGKGRLYVVNDSLFGGGGSVLQFPVDANYNHPPSHSVGGLSNPTGIAIGK